jgi:hypothetical protein
MQLSCLKHAFICQLKFCLHDLSAFCLVFLPRFGCKFTLALFVGHKFIMIFLPLIRFPSQPWMGSRTHSGPGKYEFTLLNTSVVDGYQLIFSDSDAPKFFSDPYTNILTLNFFKW